MPLRTFFAVLLLSSAIVSCSSLNGSIFGRKSGDQDYLIVTARRGDTTAMLAEKYLGDRAKAWVIEDLNDVRHPQKGQKLAIPRGAFALPPLADGRVQTVPILAYHRFTNGPYKNDRLELAAADFEKQILFLKNNGYRVISMADFSAHIEHNAPIPRNAVVITIDDGFRSVYDVAYPVLRKHHVPATVYVYADFIGAPAALTWRQMGEMIDSGLVDIQPHSKTHANLVLKNKGESAQAYKRRIRDEFTKPAQLLEQKLGQPIHSFAYPYGAVDEDVAAVAEKSGYATAVTILRGANASFADPFLLRRSMVYGDHSMSDFKRFLKVSAGA